MKTKKIMLFISLILFTGCTTKTLYKNVQYEAEFNCRSQPPSEVEQCLENLNKKTYEEYKKEY